MGRVKSQIKEATSTIIALVIAVVVLGTLFALDVVTGVTFINITTFSTNAGALFTGIAAILGAVGAFYGIRWLLSAIYGDDAKSSEMLG